MVFVEVDGMVFLKLSGLFYFQATVLGAFLQCVELLLYLVGCIGGTEGAARRRFQGHLKSGGKQKQRWRKDNYPD